MTATSAAVGSPHSSASSSSSSSPSSGFAFSFSAGSDVSDRASARGTPLHLSLNLPRTSSGTGGCWTCRLRRKKCDEERTGDSCATCLRLDIQCLGWGAKRPDWLKDKQAQENFKTEIRARLLATGRIRGVPRGGHRRSPPDHLGPLLTGIPPGFIPAPEFDMPGVAGPGPHSAGSYDTDYGFNPYAGSFHHHPGAAAYGETGLIPSPFDHTSPFMPGAFMDPNAAIPLVQSPAASVSALTSATPVSAGPHPHFNSKMQSHVPSPIDQAAGRARLLQYYSDHVLNSLFPYASDAVRVTLQTVSSQEPQGAVVNSLCALASLHYSRVNGPNPDFGDPKTFYDHAFLMLLSSQQVHGRNSEMDALAADHLVLYSLMSGGLTEWQPAQEIACGWLSNSNLMVDENPRTSVLNMSAAGRLAAKMTMWLDIVVSMSLAQPPRFLALYRRMTGSGGGASGLWTRAPGEPASEASIESVVGVPDALGLALAETAALAYWKDQELRRGALSVRELVRRADAVEHTLRRAMGPTAPPALRRGSMDAPGGEGSPLSAELGADLHRVAVDALKETAVLYISTVVSGHSPAVPEIAESVKTITRLLHALPASATDRMLVLPLFLAGCLSEPSAREFYAQRIQTLLPAHGAVLQLNAVMSGMWRQRDTRGSCGDWRNIAGQLRMSVLLM